MPDTPANQKAWPQASTQKPGLGFPIARLVVHQLRLKVEQHGFRVRTLVLVTTLLDTQFYSKQELSDAFRLQWHIELDLRAIKQTMDMSVLRCKTPEMVRKGIWIKLLGYNLIRATMAQAPRQAGLQPRDISFAGTVQTINAFAPMLQQATKSTRRALILVILRAIAGHRVADRPNRYEPRAVKRRAKPLALLTVPREQAKNRLVNRKAA